MELLNSSTKLLLGFLLAFWTSLNHAALTEVQNSAQAIGRLQSLTPNIGLLSGDIEYAQTDIIGSLPFISYYKVPTRASTSSTNNVMDPYISNGGWYNNYSNSVRVFPIQNSTGKMYDIRLPGNEQPLYIVKGTVDVPYEQGGGTYTFFKRMYTNDFYAHAATKVPVKTYDNLGDYSITTHPFSSIIDKNLLVITDKKKGIVYTMAPNWSSGSSTKYYRIQSISYSNGNYITLSYDNELNLTEVQNNRGMKLVFSRPTSNLPSQRKAINSVTLYQGDTASQTVSFENTAKTFLDFNNTLYTTYVPTSSTSSVFGKKHFEYADIYQPALAAYLQSTNKTRKQSANIPMLSAVAENVNGWSKIYQRRWSVAQKYTNNSWSGSTSVKVYSPLDSGEVDSYNIDYLQTGQIDVSQLLNSSGLRATASITVQADNSVEGQTLDSNATFTVTGYPVLKVDGRSISTVSLNSIDGRIQTYKDRLGTQYDFTYDNQNRIIKQIAGVGLAIAKTMNYEYGQLADGSVNNYATPTSIIGPNLNVTNSLNSRGQILQQTTSSPQGGSSTRTVNYTYFEDTTQPTFGLLNSRQGSRTDVSELVYYNYDSWGNIVYENKAVNNRSGQIVYRTTYFKNYNSAYRLVLLRA